ncbi:hypothetical protein K438DRAFT_1799774 [Mycena galopus ATCC 62051]|nr:hypothetical protein K438DRAFT_1799774 [Mycena galopus ATCC 62051]
MVSGQALLIEGEIKYEAGQVPEALELYRRAVVQILNHENVLQKLQFPGLPETLPRSCFKSDDRRFTQDAFPDAYDLIYSFRSSSPKAHRKFTGSQGQRLLKAMQISAGLTLGLHLDKLIAEEVKQIRENLATLIQHDAINATMSGQGALRKEVLNTPHARLGIAGDITPLDTFVVATDACGRSGCSNRGVSYKRCSKCKKVACAPSPSSKYSFLIICTDCGTTCTQAV